MKLITEPEFVVKFTCNHVKATQILPVLISTKSSLNSSYDEGLDHAFSTDDREVEYISLSFLHLQCLDLFEVEFLEAWVQTLHESPDYAQ